MKEREFGIIEKQRVIDWCGPACMADAAKKLGKETSQEELASVMHTIHPDGTSHDGMIDGALALGVNFRASQQSSLKRLNEEIRQGRQVIINFMDGSDYQNDGHYSILAEVKKKLVLLNDPQGEGYLRVMNRREFERKWFDFEGEKRVQRWALVLWPRTP